MEIEAYTKEEHVIMRKACSEMMAICMVYFADRDKKIAHTLGQLALSFGDAHGINMVDYLRQLDKETK